MKKELITLCFIILSILNLNAQEKHIVSFFFNTGESQPTEQSMKDIDTFNLYVDQHPIVILEINGFSSIDGGADINKIISEHRLNTIKAFINPNARVLKTKAYGVDYPKELINKYPIDNYALWRRVDVIYYYTRESTVLVQDSVKTINKVNKPKVDLSEYIDTVQPSVEEDIYSKKMKEGDVFQMELNINFYDGEAKLTTKSFPEIDKLAKYLTDNPDIQVFVRGHVCCGKAMRLSKKRAKVVCTELMKRGISKKRLRYQGFSNKLPIITPEKTEADRRRNRRVDVLFSVKGAKNKK